MNWKSLFAISALLSLFFFHSSNKEFDPIGQRALFNGGVIFLILMLVFGYLDWRKKRKEKLMKEANKK